MALTPLLRPAHGTLSAWPRLTAQRGRAAAPPPPLVPEKLVLLLLRVPTVVSSVDTFPSVCLRQVRAAVLVGSAQLEVERAAVDWRPA